MLRLLSGVMLCPLLAGCSGLAPLTEEALEAARQQWERAAPDAYRIRVEMSGERLESWEFEVLVREGRVVRLERNGQIILPGRGEDYSMAGLFNMLAQELALAREPAVLGAPPGYSAYLMARFDPQTGGLLRYLRTVGGASNNVEIIVLEYEPLA